MQNNKILYSNWWIIYQDSNLKSNQTWVNIYRENAFSMIVGKSLDYMGQQVKFKIIKNSSVATYME